MVKIKEDFHKPGIHHGVDFEDYLKIPAVSKSELWKLHSGSPAAMKHWKAYPPDPTDAMILGSALDCLVTYGLEFFHTKFCRIPPNMRRDQRSKKYQAFLDTAEAKMPLLPRTYDKLTTMRDKLLDYPLAAKRIEESNKQMTLVWETETNLGKVLMKGRPDFVTWINEEPELVDLKVTNSIKPDRFAKTALNFGYHWQAAVYLDGMSANQGYPCNQFSFIVIEDMAPFGVEVIKLSSRALELGRQQYMQTLERWQKCQIEEKWPASSGELMVLDLPRWAYRNLEEYDE